MCINQALSQGQTGENVWRISKSAAARHVIGAASLAVLIAPHAFAIDADERSCAVYQAFHRAVIPSWGNLVLRPVTQPLEDYDPDPSSTFERYTGERRSVRQADGQLKSEWIVQTRTFDSKPLLANLQQGEPQNIEACLSGRNIRFDEYDLVGVALILPKLISRLFGSEIGETTMTLSPVSFSADGQYALMTSSVVCGLLCGSGDYHLFKKDDDEWIYEGGQLMWIS